MSDQGYGQIPRKRSFPAQNALRRQQSCPGDRETCLQTVRTRIFFFISAPFLPPKGTPFGPNSGPLPPLPAALSAPFRPGCTQTRKSPQNARNPSKHAIPRKSAKNAEKARNSQQPVSCALARKFIAPAHACTAPAHFLGICPDP